MKGVWTGEKIKDKGKRIKVGGAGRRQAKVRGKRQETRDKQPLFPASMGFL